MRFFDLMSVLRDGSSYSSYFMKIMWFGCACFLLPILLSMLKNGPEQIAVLLVRINWLNYYYLMINKRLV